MQRVNTGVLSAAIDTLHGARQLPPREAVERLSSFLEGISAEFNGRLAETATAALNLLVTSLGENGFATDEAWQHAIETMVSLANNPK